MLIKKLAEFIGPGEVRWEGTEPSIEATFRRMARIAYDPESDSALVSYLEVDLEAREIDTEWGPTRQTDGRDAVMVKSKEDAGFRNPVEVSGGSPGTKLDPKIDARGGRACVVWCACEPETKKWRVFAAYSKDCESWDDPFLVSSDGEALHPSVALDPDTGSAWIAYEDWGDGSIKLAEFDGEECPETITLSEGGRNFRPRVVLTDKAGRHRGSVAVAWDSYRNGQYDIYLRLLGPDRVPGPERRATMCPRWDSHVDLIEDLDGNLWITWVRASNEVGEMSAMRNVHVKYFDGERWYYPYVPRWKYNPFRFRIAESVFGQKGARGGARKAGADEDGDGRITWYTVNWFPRLQVDRRNRVYVFYREGSLSLPPMHGYLKYRVYEGNRWSRPRSIRLGRGINILRLLRDFSVAVTNGDRIEGIWDQAYINIAKEVLGIAEIKSTPIRDVGGRRLRVSGEAREESVHPGWPRRKTLEPPRTMELNGERLELLFGDTHNHSSVSVGIDPPDYHYHFARDYARLDFFALPENDYFFCGVPGIESYISFLPKVFSSEDFVCFQAHEFVSSAKGHRVMVFEGDDKRIMPLGVFNSQRGELVNTTGHLFHFLHEFDVGEGSRVITASHNMINLGNDFKEYDDSLEPVYDVASAHFPAEKTFEEYKAEGDLSGSNKFLETLMGLSIVSTGGRSEHTPSKGWYYSWRQCLDAGLCLGAYGSSDNHCCCGIGWVTAGVWSAGRNRKSILDAISERRTFAVDNQLRMTDILNTYPPSTLRRMDQEVMRVDLRFRLDGCFMGSKCAIESPPTARVEIFSQEPDDPLERIVFVKDGCEVHSACGGGVGTVQEEWRDDGRQPGRHYYYVRAEFSRGTRVYSSPVFVDYC